MRETPAPLSPHDAMALRKIEFDRGDQIEPDHIRRLLRLELIEWNGWRWSLTQAGRRVSAGHAIGSPVKIKLDAE